MKLKEKLIIICILLQLPCTIAKRKSSSTCDNCCQGQTGREGNPGIPGVPGTNGNQGNMGPKGDKGDCVNGETGDVTRGEKGDTGSPGSKGEQGLLGPAGPVGPAGSPGATGQKGEIGQGQGNSLSSLSAFTVVRNSPFTPKSTNIPLPFEEFQTNVGDDYDLASGRFTCEIPGIYSFTYYLLTSYSNPCVQLMKNNTVINSVVHDDSAVHDMLSNGAVLQLNAGDEVWLRCHRLNMIFSGTNHYTTFTGVLLHKL